MDKEIKPNIISMKRVDSGKAWQEEAEDDVWMNTLAVLNSIRAHDSTEEANRSKDFVWARVEKKTFSHSPKPEKRSNRMILRITAVAASLVVGLIASFFSYRSGYNGGIDQLVATTVDIQTPKGVVTELTLPDGTSVTLNGGSRLSYPSLFATDLRKITLDGEAFFDVVSDQSRPFIVQSIGMNIRVLGTQFSIKSYSDDPEVLVTLAKGRVNADIDYGHIQKSVLMYPNQQVQFNRMTGKIIHSDGNVSENMAWKRGELFFRNTSLDEICRQLERKFDVQILIEDPEVAQKTYYADFEKGENLNQILDVLSHKNNWESHISGKNVTIYTTK